MTKTALLVRYGLVGGTGAGIQIGMLYVWVDILHLEALYLAGAALGFCAALAVTFTLQKYWTFRDFTRDAVRQQFSFYSVFALISLGLNILLLHVSKVFIERLDLDFFSAWYVGAQIVIVVFFAGISFLANYLITFRSVSKSKEASGAP